MAKHTLTGSGAPTTTPTELNQHYLDTVSGKFYFSKGTSSSADWAEATPTVLGPELEAIKAAGGSAAGRVPYYTGPGTASVAVFTTAGRNLVAGIDVAAQKTTLGLNNVPNVDATVASNITQDSTHRFVTDTEKTTWNSKEGAITPGTTGDYFRGDKTFQPLNKAAVGLGNCENTSDLNKPISTATQTALNAKEPTISAGTTGQYWRGDKSWQTLDKTAVGLSNVPNTDATARSSHTGTQLSSTISDFSTAADARITAQKGAANGLCPLDATSKIAAIYIPGSYDDVLEYANLAAFPVTGESGKIYTALDTNLTYRWSGSTYAVLNPSLALGETSTTAYRGDRGKTAYDHSQTTGNAHSMTKADISLGNCDNTSDLNKPISTATQTALNAKEPTITGGTATQFWNGLKAWTTLVASHISDFTSAAVTAAKTNLTNTPPPLQNLTDAAFQGASQEFARRDHTHAFNNSGVTPGAYGSSLSVPTVTVNSKGQVTAASSTAIPEATQFASGLMSDSDKIKLDQLIGKQGVYISSDYTSTSNSTWTELTDFTYILYAGFTYHMKFLMLYTTSATSNGIAGQISGTSNGTYNFIAMSMSNSTSLVGRSLQNKNTPVTFTSTPLASPNENLVIFEGVFKCTTSGTFIFQFRNEGPGQTIVVKTGTHGEFHAW
jgi:hypothetical protein